MKTVIYVARRILESGEEWGAWIAACGRMFWFKTIVSGGFLCGIALSLNLWLPGRTIPRVPVFPVNGTGSPLIEWGLFVVLLGSLGATMFLRWFTWAAAVAAGTTVLFVLLDQIRLQPWVFQYGFFLIVLASVSERESSGGNQSRALNAARFILASFYFYSGLQKLNSSFLNELFPWFVQPAMVVLPAGAEEVLSALGLFVALFEVAIGVGLITNRCRRFAIGGVIVTSVFSLLMLGPLGHNHNSVVWPWNVAMILLAPVLFRDTPDVLITDIISIRSGLLNAVVVAVFGVLPLLSFVGLWDSYLSVSLYSGNKTRGELVFSPIAYTSLSSSVKQFPTQTNKKGMIVLDIFEWSIADVNVPPYPEKRVFKHIGRSVCEMRGGGTVKLVINERATLLEEEKRSVYRCRDLK